MNQRTSGTRRPRVALYARVSTARDQDPQLQLEELHQVAHQRGWQVIGEFVQESRRITGTVQDGPDGPA